MNTEKFYLMNRIEFHKELMRLTKGNIMKNKNLKRFIEGFCYALAMFALAGLFVGYIVLAVKSGWIVGTLMVVVTACSLVGLAHSLAHSFGYVE
tara:strand:- start:610 stop:891 length:282 start_codon:yes stop_codon:yes gene_type:complete